MSAATLPVPQAPAPERTKTRLLELVKRHGAQTAQDLAQGLDISVPAARRHLCDLQEQGLVEARTERPGGRGRPQHVYALTERGEAAFPKTYSSLCVDVLRHIESLFGGEALLKVLDARNAEIAGRFRSELAGDLPLGERVQNLVRRLNEHGFDASAVQDERGQWTFTQHNCPNLTVARQYSQLCSAEITLYGDLLGVPVTRETRIACGQGSCRYRVG
ncbi:MULTISPECIES: metalloregulator ArsR/SmtB family transcription factor [unclassified Deinococcus]|jgi:predicted ArsR family transcriptional regulator|uniref:helix-turn-helix transcriptional regulator n=1 Tax=unclassified Deinococcus TaxID=2623546 RepID=UPI0006DC83CA|nr:MULTISPECIES: metalloregulator ArsR/SmtB family transcription factor [unclassified Deinococcus]MBX8464953.1 transcriptional regulator [Deinococcus sp. RIT780]MCD0161184.1 transcriptional regulator [Deinococcus sp. 6YEL10]MCD0165751.1 transcriptional regulator [Deinococcus sp. 12RED42]MCD0169922.1 transcriptional regulator [Deinococcus sp. 23YEL01]MCD0176756.1 transcriptional regulator [Deinococcus sp. 14RED07]